MSTEPFIGEIKIFAFNFAPRGYSFCSGQTLSISQNTALFALLGTTYGGNGQTTFVLPDLRGRVAIGQGQGNGLSNYVLGQVSGSENTTLLATNMPAHTHTAQVNVNNTAANVATPVAGSSLAAAKDVNGDNASIYTATAPNTALSSGSVTVGVAGGSQPFSNLQPYLALNYSIALQGIFPSRN
jgi:microcystin-dependent protein